MANDKQHMYISNYCSNSITTACQLPNVIKLKQHFVKVRTVPSSKVMFPHLLPKVKIYCL